MIDIKGLSKAEVLAGLYNASHVQGMGFLQAIPGSMTAEHAQTIIDQGITDFDYLHGKVMKVNLSGDTFDEWLYDRDNCTGAAQLVIDKIRQ